MRDIRNAIHTLDNDLLIDQFHSAYVQSPDDEYIQILLEEILDRQLTIEEVLLQPELH
ncbi:sporulation histidine kinase inhibitor Sda [Cohnella endophytica]|uniref:Sporulation histidine kinase inhibitor Sda n=1 Tax=Cohnella endophytica TaxID=2419778 RepID=A0A494XHI5_9BACL|nr:sporulation histidine kinase inhibitor Sda [Cohnella endophytica]RKP50100.1 sporulation histidine kinase inhibitor Sda [Cohnella endophytica]